MKTKWIIFLLGLAFLAPNFPAAYACGEKGAQTNQSPSDSKITLAGHEASPRPRGMKKKIKKRGRK